MYDYSKKITNFHDQHITLTLALRSDMKSRRDTNKKRIIDGLSELGKPVPIDWINQGGYAQQTMTQPPEGDEESRYDIDMGVVFEKNDTKTPATTKGWVRDAISKKASSMKHEPECKPKCVRIEYATGYQCDFPVFRIEDSANGSHELASASSWIASNPRSMNAWIDERVGALSPAGNGISQLRQVIRFIKYFAKVKSFKKSRKYPSGLVATAIAIEHYVAADGRNDEAIRETLRGISLRSKDQAVFANGTQVSDDKDTERLHRLIHSAKDAVSELDNLADDAGDVEAAKVWKKVFNHSFFDDAGISSSTTTASTAATILGGLGLSSAARAERASSSVTDTLQKGGGEKPWSPNIE